MGGREGKMGRKRKRGWWRFLGFAMVWGGSGMGRRRDGEGGVSKMGKEKIGVNEIIA